jgi:hypothetical protein
MKISIILTLVCMSSAAIAEPSMMELWRDNSGHHSFSDKRYQQQYSPEQRQRFMDQRNAEIAHRHNAEMAKESAHFNEMQQRYASERASREFIAETRDYNMPPITPIPQMGQYYPGNNYYGNPYGSYYGGNYYGNGVASPLYTPAQTQGFIDQYNIDRARQAQVAQEQADADYQRWRQQQNSRRDTERFIGFGK